MFEKLAGSANRDLIRLFITLFLSFGWVALVLRGGWSLGFFLAVLLTEAVFIIWLLPFAVLPNNGRSGRVFLPFLTVSILLLAFSMLLFSNPVLKALNVLALLILIPLQYLFAAGVFQKEWDRPLFWLEAAISFFLRPFLGLPGFAGCLRRLFGKQADAPDAGSTSRHAVGRILLGIILAIPVLLLSGSLLASADPIFAQWTDKFWQQFSLGEQLLRLLLSLVFLPFIFSFLYSGKTQQSLLASSDFSPTIEKSKTIVFRIDKIILITFLTLINLLYIIFSVVQLAYLTGAFQAVLPADLTYAEYARSGFFELAGVSALNLLLVLAAVKGSERKGTAGVILRIESLLLIFGSLVQWASAMFRMKMYIDVFGLSLLRFWVTAFMLLMVVFFILMVIKEFRPVFPLFKLSFAAALTALLVLNFVNCDAWIARHNARHYNQTGQIDTGFFHELSASAVPVMLELTLMEDSTVAREMASQLLDRRQNDSSGVGTQAWTRYNVSQDQALKQIDQAYDRLSGLIEEPIQN